MGAALRALLNCYDYLVLYLGLALLGTLCLAWTPLALIMHPLLSERAVGAINVYSRQKDAFDDRAAELGELFATPAAVAVHNAQILAQAQELTVQLQAALSSRPIIDQAIGILRGRNGGSAEEAFGRLRAISQADHVKLVDVAQHIVDEAVRRARARHTSS